MHLSEDTRIQFWLLVFISLAFLWAVPSVWFFQPDSGIYVGTAAELLATGRYVFNGHPNLLYFPGLSVPLAGLIGIFGMNFQVLNLLGGAAVVAALWLSRSLFAPACYGWPGWWVPLLLACASVLQEQVQRIMSDALFLAVTLAALLCWRLYLERERRGWLIACWLLVAWAPLLRFQGVFLVGAFGLALLWRAWRTGEGRSRRIVWALLLALSAGVPFFLWLGRNYLLYTPETYNMANAFFFGQSGLRLYAPDSGTMDKVTPDWLSGGKLVLYHALFTFRDLFEIFFGKELGGSVGLYGKAAVVLLPLLAGGWRWLRRAGLMEAAYVLVSLAFIASQWFGSGSAYTVPRYWIPLLPFVLLIWMSGLALVGGYLRERVLATPARALGLMVLALVLGNGAYGYARLIHPWHHNYYANANAWVGDVKAYLDTHAAPDAMVAVTDWGVMPFLLQRPSIQVLDDPSHVYSLERLVRYRARYLVILDKEAAFPPYAKAMVKDLPEVFHLVLDARKAGKPGPDIEVYAVDLDRAEKALAGLRGTGKRVGGSGLNPPATPSPD